MSRVVVLVLCLVLFTCGPNTPAPESSSSQENLMIGVWADSVETKQKRPDGSGFRYEYTFANDYTWKSISNNSGRDVTQKGTYSLDLPRVNLKILEADGEAMEFDATIIVSPDCRSFKFDDDLPDTAPF